MTLTTRSCPAGNYSIMAIYGGDSAYSTSTSGVIVVTITSATAELHDYVLVREQVVGGSNLLAKPFIINTLESLLRSSKIPK